MSEASFDDLDNGTEPATTRRRHDNKNRSTHRSKETTVMATATPCVARTVALQRRHASERVEYAWLVRLTFVFYLVALAVERPFRKHRPGRPQLSLLEETRQAVHSTIPFAFS